LVRPPGPGFAAPPLRPLPASLFIGTPPANASTDDPTGVLEAPQRAVGVEEEARCLPANPSAARVQEERERSALFSSCELPARPGCGVLDDDARSGVVQAQRHPLRLRG
jgi:hypothetical protein